jgi:hypothetical protein
MRIARQMLRVAHLPFDGRVLADVFHVLQQVVERRHGSLPQRPALARRLILCRIAVLHGVANQRVDRESIAGRAAQGDGGKGVGLELVDGARAVRFRLRLA